MPIPNPGWGAVEIVIWQMKINLEKAGQTADILNRRGLIPALKTKPWDYDLVHLEYDDLAGFWLILARIFKFKLVITSHYGYSAWPTKWHWSYRRIFRKLLKAPTLIVLSEEIKATYLQAGYSGMIEVLPNGTEVADINFSLEGQKDLICLGKIEPRKRQCELAEIFSRQSNLKIDFVGPIVDKRFRCNNQTTFYLGSWTRAEVQQNLTQYKALVLLSDGEAHALVIGEALAAGLSLIISPEAAANLDLSQPFVQIIRDDQELLASAQSVCLANSRYRSMIRKYAQNNFTWTHIIQRYLVIVEKILMPEKYAVSRQVTKNYREK